MIHNHFICSEVQLESYSCKQCSFENHFLINLRLHFESEDTTDVNPYNCEDCNFTTFSQLMMLVHPKFCLVANNQNKNLKAHVLLKRTLDQAVKKWFRCPHCPYKTTMKSNFHTHLLCHVDPEDTYWFQCDKCSYKSKWGCVLKRHKLFKHTSADLIKWFQCEQCSYKAKAKNNLKSHMLTHSKPKKRKWDDETDWFRCDQCPFKSKWPSAVKRHKSNKHSQGPDELVPL